ncbi:hypothetical protein LCGC14_0914890 [marine sediment metagenome]|uniref:Histidine kinase N-terminal 7TM region domain-containing protein n=1 Tax=marine sediment metagenome TaxID=412755 RepID=A0A0F9NSH9_9ZZZZ
MIIDIFLIITSIFISTIGIISVYKNRENFGNLINVILNILLYLILGVFFLSTSYLSIQSILSEGVSIVLWHISIVFWIFSINLLSVIHRFIIKLEEKGILSFFILSLITGIIIGLLFLPNSFEIRLANNTFSFLFKNLYLLISLLLYNLIVVGLMWYNLIKYFSRIRDKKSQMILSILTIQFSFFVLLYSFYLITQNQIFRVLFFVFYLIGSTFASYAIIMKTFLFIELTNKIYDFIIFHKSGILLYSFNFETGEETDESILKGSILIGINHILSNFINKKDQLNLIKMKNRDIILEYDNSLGYALLLTTNHKNAYIEKAVKNFIDKFNFLNKEKLLKLSGLIDITEFGSYKLIVEFFHPFIIQNQKSKV